jgi:hypothetical protein
LRRFLPPLVTVAVFLLIFRRIPFARFVTALEGADHLAFITLMLPNGLLYFAWDTLILALAMRWFHGGIRYGELLPVRAVTYVVSFLNTNLARAATAYYLTRKLRVTFLPMAGTVIFLTLLEMTHLVAWSTLGLTLFPGPLPRPLLLIPILVTLFWAGIISYARGTPAGNISGPSLSPAQPPAFRLASPRTWPVFQTFTAAPLKRYAQVILLRAPLFAASLVFHYFGVQTFGMEIPFIQLVAFLPVIFMLAAMPITVAHLGTTQAAWIFFFRDAAPEAQLLAYSLASHLAFMFARASVGIVFMPRAYRELFGPIRWEELLTARQPATQPTDP